jgi:hypothetical protein
VSWSSGADHPPVGINSRARPHRPQHLTGHAGPAFLPSPGPHGGLLVAFPRLATWLPDNGATRASREEKDVGRRASPTPHRFLSRRSMSGWMRHSSATMPDTSDPRSFVGAWGRSSSPHLLLKNHRKLQCGGAPAPARRHLGA